MSAEEKQKQTYTPEQMEQRREAVKRYQKKVDRINCLFPPGTKDRITAAGFSCNSFIKETVLAELDRIEKYKTKSTK